MATLGRVHVEIKPGPNLILLYELIRKLSEVCELIPDWQHYEAQPILDDMSKIIEKMFRE